MRERKIVGLCEKRKQNEVLRQCPLQPFPKRQCTNATGVQPAGVGD